MDEGRSCGDCSLCCKLLGVEAIDKPAGSWCGHFHRGRGCSVYETRPAACATFNCLWLSSPGLDERWLPDRSHLVLFTEQDGRRLTVVVDPSDPLAWRREPFYSRIKAMSQRAADGYELLISTGDRRAVVFPDQDIDLGLVDPSHKIISGYADRDGARVPFAMVLSDVADATVIPGP
ncbi:MAG: YkgJ family cysteine cluster protein [Phenylobacterium sp.]|uniref:YkgJ family cysteine cluster protein n=1 Tax=Phenylobacterium sp. TaxID=1871053 RepID=UPI002732A9A3|nr:YkgJ family cysteine cluster protein [Phenylobacterium sp.]MDP3174533.1 YkgJ family cysteine cluster protein [Phenylobacterium sp.]